MLAILFILPFVSALDLSIISPQEATYNSTEINLEVSSSSNVSWIYSLNSAANTSFAPNTTITAIEGNNNLIVTVINNSNLSQTSSQELNFTVDIPPRLDIISPTNGSFYNGTELNYSASTDATECSYSLDFGITNHSITCNTLIDISTLNETNQNISIYVKDSLGNQNSSYFTFSIDRTSPIITLNNPQDGASHTDNSPTTFYYVVNESNIQNCYLIINDVIQVAVGASDITINQESSIASDGALSNGGHTWAISCIDKAGNEIKTSTRSLTVSYSTDSDSSSSSSSSSGSSSGSSSSSGEQVFIGRTFTLTESQCNSGVSKQLRQDDKLKFSLVNGEDTETHFVKVKRITNTKVDITIESDPIDLSLSIGDENKVDITNDEVYDVQIRLLSISGQQAKLSFKTISEEVQEEETELVEEIVESTDEGNFITGAVTGLLDKVDKKTMYIAGGFIGVILIAFIIFIFVKKSKKKGNGKSNDIILKNAEKIKAKSKREKKVSSGDDKEMLYQWEEEH